MVTTAFPLPWLRHCPLHHVDVVSVTKAITVLMQFRTASMSAMLAIPKHGVCEYNRTMFGQFHNGRHGCGTKLH